MAALVKTSKLKVYVLVFSEWNYFVLLYLRKCIYHLRTGPFHLILH